MPGAVISARPVLRAVVCGCYMKLHGIEPFCNSDMFPMKTGVQKMFFKIFSNISCIIYCERYRIFVVDTNIDISEFQK